MKVKRLKSWFLFLLISISAFSQRGVYAQINVNYKIITNTQTGFGFLEGYWDENKQALTDSTVEECLEIYLTKDFNNDGYKDALVEIVNGCGGNCCGNSYFFVFFNGTEFIKSEIYGYDWNGVEIDSSNGLFKINIQNINAGFGNTTSCQDEEYQFIIEEFSFEPTNILMSFSEFPKALLELKSEDFVKTNDDNLFQVFDIDGDSIADTIHYSYWERWASIGSWRIEFGNGESFKSNLTCKRIGILKSKTNGVNDLLIDCDQFLKWNGKTFK